MAFTWYKRGMIRGKFCLHMGFNNDLLGIDMVYVKVYIKYGDLRV